ncbi:MAG TPA: phosphatase PAP2 family protein [Symbiobacteriaceae bacterium]|nr:phosphatase PAP2 family protein [Symbiobacteriaceae bacterium]
MQSAPSGRGQVQFTSSTPVEPQAGTWRMMCAPDSVDYRLPPPPANSSAATAAELAELRILAQNRTAQDVQQIMRWSLNERSVLAHWETLANLLAQRYELSPPAASRINYALTTAVHGALLAGWKAKYQYLRPRPSALDRRVNPNIIPVPSHPAYPSGHALAAGAASTVLTRFFPAEAGVIEALAQDSGMSRLKAGIHYRTDFTAGMALGRQVAADVIRTMVDRDGGPRAYAPRPGTSPLRFREYLLMLDRVNAISPGSVR